MNHGQGLGTLDSSQSREGTFSGISGARHRHRDNHTLARLGKKQVLKVGSCNRDTAFANRQVTILYSGALVFSLFSVLAVQYWPRGKQL